MLEFRWESAERIEDVFLLQAAASSTRLPSARHVAMLPQAREDPHPSVMKETWSTLPFRAASQNSMVSPQGPVMRA